MAWHNAYEKIKPYVVKIETPSGFGTGFLFAFNTTKTIVAIATALHVIDDAEDWRQPFRITQYASGKQVFLEYADRVVMLDYKRDTAAIAFDADLLECPESTLPLLPDNKVKKVGVQIGWVGFPALAPANLCFFQGGISAYVDEDDYYLIDGVAINGVSGGPVFAELNDATPQIVGVVSAYLANRQRGDTLPGLLKAYDLTHLHAMIAQMKSLDEARKAEEGTREQQKQEERPAEAAAIKPAASNSSAQGTPLKRRP